jgi:hypothetical protein
MITTQEDQLRLTERRKATAMENPQTADRTAPALHPLPAAPITDTVMLRSLLEKKSDELEKSDIGSLAANICGPI